MARPRRAANAATEQGAAPDGIRVRALAPGYFDVYREVGAEFTVPDEQSMGRWMKRLDEPAPADKPAD